MFNLLNDTAMAIQDWLVNNPSGYDHHDPQNTINDFEDWMNEVNEDAERDFGLK